MHFWFFILSDYCKDIFSSKSWAEMKMAHPSVFNIVPYKIEAVVR